MHRFKVSGMTCGHCVKAVTTAVKSVDQAASIEVDLTSGEVKARSTANANDIASAIKSAGYEVERRI